MLGTAALFLPSRCTHLNVDCVRRYLSFVGRSRPELVILQQSRSHSSDCDTASVKIHY